MLSLGQLCLISSFPLFLFFCNQALELVDTLHAEVVGNHQEESWLCKHVVWHLVPALVIEPYLHPVFSLLASQVEQDSLTVVVGYYICTLAAVKKDETILVKLEFANQDQAVSTEVLVVLMHWLQTKDHWMKVFFDLVPQLVTLKSLFNQNRNCHVHEVLMSCEPVEEVWHMFGDADEVTLLDHQERLGKQH